MTDPLYHTKQQVLYYIITTLLKFWCYFNELILNCLRNICKTSKTLRIHSNVYHSR